ncbi:hypothetical protein LCGC14_0953450 [marine sediment metagenome]|uniref:Uncharacterized protein n=1 Tax=marine sediment metagenome TaxID=412755 RepID=A0A0F9P2N8_9ZZZZ
METIYVFKVALKYRKGLWRRIEIELNNRINKFAILGTNLTVYNI